MSGFHKTTYVISLPPLSFGGFHDRVTLDPVISSYSSGASGGEGRSETEVITLAISLLFKTVT
jgi:hypothetical protein